MDTKPYRLEEKQDVDRTPYKNFPDTCKSCAQYAKCGGGPYHNGSPRCRSGSIASGGHNAHCACDTCF